MDTGLPVTSSPWRAAPTTGPAVPVPVVAVVLKGYPRLSETFIAQELLGLERRGLHLQIWSLRRAYDPTTHPIHDEIAAPVHYLPEYLWRAPQRVWRGWRWARQLPGYAAAWQIFLRDLVRDRTPNRIRRFGQACVLAAELPADVSGIYAHFLHTPASTARYAAHMRGLPFAISAHAKDIWTSPDWEIAEKIADAAWLTTCTAAGAARLRACARTGSASAGDKVHLNYHGLDLERFAPPANAPDTAAVPPRDGSDRARPAVIVSVGRLVAKKGYDDLLTALAALPDGCEWRLIHIGGGPLKDRLADLAMSLGIAERIDWRGRRAQDMVLDALRAADLFVLASRVADDGDRDGLPNVLMEAQSQRLACVATNVSGIPELIVDGVTGLLVPARDTAAIATAIAALVRDPLLRERLGAAAAERLAAHFSMNAGLNALDADLRATFTPHIVAGID
jgi:glycosyltransferase involved in cell wall biosynthesis